MSSCENNSLLDVSKNSSSKIVLSSVAGACFALALVTYTSATTSVYVTPSSTVANQASAVVFSRAQPQVGIAARPTLVSAAYDRTGAEYEPMFMQSTSNWAPLTALAAIPVAVLAALQFFRNPVSSPVDPIDMLTPTSGTKWVMAAGSDESLAKSYATALLELAEEGESLEQVHNDVENFVALMEDEETGEFLGNPVVDPEEIKEVLNDICEEYSFSDITKDFLYLLVDEALLGDMPAIAEEFDKEYYEATDTEIATVTAADALDEEQLRMLANKLHEITKAKNIKIKSQVDESLMAGFVLEFGKSGSQQIDLSLKKQIDELRMELQEGAKNITELFGEVPAAVQLMAAAVGVNALLAHEANASGNIFDFNATLPLQVVQFLLLMVFLEKTVFTPVGKILDERAAKIKAANAAGSDNSKIIAELNAKAEALLEAARKDVAKQLDATKKAAAADIAQQLNAAKAKNDKVLVQGLDELRVAKDELWAELEKEVVPALADEIVTSLEGGDEEEGASQPETVAASQ